jgi:hypothetical protein
MGYLSAPEGCARSGGHRAVRRAAAARSDVASAAELSERFRAHLEAEERLIFPAIRERLANEGLAIWGEMRARRG